MTELKPQNQTRSVHNTPHLGAKQERSLWSSQQQSKRKKPDFHEDPKASDGQPTAQRGQLCQVRGVTQAKEQRMSTNSRAYLGALGSVQGKAEGTTRDLLLQLHCGLHINGPTHTETVFLSTALDASGGVPINILHRHSIHVNDFFFPFLFFFFESRLA